MKLINPKKYEVKKIADNSYEVVGLKAIGTIFSNGFNPVDGAIAILRCKNYDGYCQLFYPYSESGVNEDGNTLHVEFVPCVNEDGSSILIKFDHDVIICCGFNRDYKGEDFYFIEKSLLSYTEYNKENIIGE